MTKQTIQLIALGVIILLGGVCVWQLFSVYRLNGRKPDSTAIDYAQLERAVSLWSDRKEFSFEGGNQATSSARRTPEEEQGEVLVVVRNGSGVAGAASGIADQIEALAATRVVSIGNATETPTTSVAYKESVPAETSAAIITILEEKFSTVSQSTLPENDENDVVVTLGT